MVVMFDFIAGLEEFRAKAYQDEAGVWTFGYGQTTYAGGIPVKRGDTTDLGEAKDYLSRELDKVTYFVQRRIAETTKRCQVIAMVSLAYNIGMPSFATSTVLRCHRLKQYQEAADAFLMWNKLHRDGKLIASAGLLNRRKTERALYISESAIKSLAKRPRR